MQIYKSVLITSPTGFDIAFTNVEDTLKQPQDKVEETDSPRVSPSIRENR